MEALGNQQVVQFKANVMNVIKRGCKFLRWDESFSTAVMHQVVFVQPGLSNSSPSLSLLRQTNKLTAAPCKNCKRLHVAPKQDCCRHCSFLSAPSHRSLCASNVCTQAPPNDICYVKPHAVQLGHWHKSLLQIFLSQMQIV